MGGKSCAFANLLPSPRARFVATRRAPCPCQRPCSFASAPPSPPASLRPAKASPPWHEKKGIQSDSQKSGRETDPTTQMPGSGGIERESARARFSPSPFPFPLAPPFLRPAQSTAFYNPFPQTKIMICIGPGRSHHKKIEESHTPPKTRLGSFPLPVAPREHFAPLCEAWRGWLGGFCHILIAPARVARKPASGGGVLNTPLPLAVSRPRPPHGAILLLHTKLVI